jgi:hypothetical protein
MGATTMNRYSNATMLALAVITSTQISAQLNMLKESASITGEQAEALKVATGELNGEVSL